MVGRQVRGLGLGDEALGVHVHAHVARSGGHPDHGTSHQTDLPPRCPSGDDGGFHSRHIGGEAGHGDPAGLGGDDLDQFFPNVGLGPRPPLHEDIGGIADHGQDALVAEMAQGLSVSDLAQQGVGVDLPVAGVQNHPQGRADDQAIGLGDGVGQGDHLHVEGPEDHVPAEGDDVEFDLVLEVPLPQLLAQEEGGEGRRVERCPQARPEPGHGADVILVRVGQDDPENVIGMRLDPARVREDDVDAGRILPAEGHAQVRHDPAPPVWRAVAVEVEVHTDLVGPAKGQENEFVVGARACHLADS